MTNKKILWESFTKVSLRVLPEFQWSSEQNGREPARKDCRTSNVHKLSWPSKMFWLFTAFHRLYSKLGNFTASNCTFLLTLRQLMRCWSSLLDIGERSLRSTVSIIWISSEELSITFLWWKLIEMFLRTKQSLDFKLWISKQSTLFIQQVEHVAKLSSRQDSWARNFFFPKFFLEMFFF